MIKILILSCWWQDQELNLYPLLYEGGGMITCQIPFNFSAKNLEYVYNMYYCIVPYVNSLKSTFHDKRSNQNIVTKKFLLHILFGNLSSFFSNPACGCSYFNSISPQFLQLQPQRRKIEAIFLYYRAEFKKKTKSRFIFSILLFLYLNNNNIYIK